MTSRLLTAALLSGLIPAAYGEAKTRTYTFASGTTPYCDGIEISQTGAFATGEIVGFTCSEQYYGAGFNGTIPGSTRQWSLVVSEPPGDASALYIYTLDEKALTWDLYYESVDYSIPLTLIGSGQLLKGEVKAQGGAKRVSDALFDKGLIRRK